MLEIKPNRKGCDGLDVERRDGGHAGQRMLKIEMPVRRKRGRPQRRFMNVVKDGTEIGWSEMEADDPLW